MTLSLAAVQLYSLAGAFSAEMDVALARLAGRSCPRGRASLLSDDDIAASLAPLREAGRLR